MNLNPWDYSNFLLHQLALPHTGPDGERLGSGTTGAQPASGDNANRDRRSLDTTDVPHHFEDGDSE